MTYLIDGHNLIGVLPDIELEDPDDEIQLVSRLKQYCSRVRKKAIVVFDGGLPGGHDPDLSNSAVKVIFASASHTNADRLLRKRIRSARDPGQFVLVSSDHEVQNAAYERRMQVLTSREFADQMAATMARTGKEDGMDDHIVSPEDVDKWLDIFNQPRADGE
jgi:predicted RNA-binding protein with PIN domain